MNLCVSPFNNFVYWINQGDIIGYDLFDNSFICSSFSNIKKIIFSSTYQLLGITEFNEITNKQILSILKYKDNNNIKDIFNGIKDSILVYSVDNKLYKIENNISSPIIINNITINNIYIGDNFSIIKDNNNKLWSWGRNDKGQLGLGILTKNIDTPTLIKKINDIETLSINKKYTILIDFDGGLWAFGSNKYGELGIGHFYDMDTPIKIENIPLINSIILRNNKTIVISSKQELWYWGKSFSNLPRLLLTDIQIQQAEIINNILIIIDLNGYLHSIQKDWKITSIILLIDNIESKLQFQELYVYNNTLFLISFDRNIYWCDVFKKSKILLYKMNNVPPMPLKYNRIKSARK